MARLSNQLLIIGCVQLLGGAWFLVALSQWASRVPEAGFWFEPVSYRSSALGDPIDAAEMRTIETIARAEVRHAFRGLRLTISDCREATWRVSVVQSLGDPRFRSHIEVAGQSRAVAGLGGMGAVSFDMLAGHAIGFAPAGADRAAMIAAIGRGIGRSAAHELAHQILPRAQIHGADVRSYDTARRRAASSTTATCVGTSPGRCS